MTFTSFLPYSSVQSVNVVHEKVVVSGVAGRIEAGRGIGELNPNAASGYRTMSGRRSHDEIEIKAEFFAVVVGSSLDVVNRQHGTGAEQFRASSLPLPFELCLGLF